MATSVAPSEIRVSTTSADTTLAAARAWCVENSVELDDSLRDMGISAFKGANRDIGALRRFHGLVAEGRVPSGSFLIVESLDRLSREAVVDAVYQLTDLIREGIVVVTLSDGQVYSEASLRTNWMPLLISITVMARAHEESRLKSERVGAAWARKKEAARTDKRPLTSRCPEWIAIEDGQFVVREDRAEIVRTIFQWAIEGYGRRQIVAKLNHAGTPTWRGGVGWQTSTVGKILTGRLVLGEYQPHSGSARAGTRQPEGTPIANFYPPIIDERVHGRAQVASKGRLVAGGRKGKGVAHLLLGRGKCARCGGAMHILNKGAKPKGGTYFACSSASRKAGCENSSRWRVDHIEARLLRGLAYLDAGAVLHGAQSTAEADRMAILVARLAKIDVGRENLLDLVQDGRADAKSRYLALCEEADVVKKELAEAAKAAASAAADPGLNVRLAEAVNLGRAMNEADGDDRHAIRTRLAEQLRQLVVEVSFDPGIGVLALLTPRPGIPADQVPAIVGASRMQPWRLWLNDDSDPSGLAGVEERPRPDEEAKALRVLQRIRGRRASA
ncbi:hypothetical protein Sa4125_00420 [Aureimonas sp. SA4125]|uniref:recombinase family protein n=1 Tax=Aureimonas sp. SA4125 TaxID=2826993 RepID=UPI001CC7B6CE|nr:recombinase family protein [Aureimonas sp. SA4125]BDA82500.1 hypothetical protein Sa4125_00420 [Aureimonas sp. SA4125]